MNFGKNSMYKNALFMCVCIIGVGLVSSQYFYYDTGVSSNGYQQGCDEKTQIRFDTTLGGANAGRVHIKLDKTKLNFETSSSVSTLRSNLFEGVANPWDDWAAPNQPIWVDTGGVVYDIIDTQRRNNADSSLQDGDYGFLNIKFVPNYSGNLYTVDFGMDYDGTTTKTTLYSGGGNVINAGTQNANLTGTISVEQKPCINDTALPIVTINVPSGSNYVENNGLDILLADSATQGSVPYIFNSGGVWTGNLGGITNQYGINSGSISIHAVGNGNNVTLNNISDFNRMPSNKTWEYKDRDYTITTGSLFDFGIEEQITIDVTIDDRVTNTSNFSTYTFNIPVAPVISNQNPVNGDVFVLLNSNIYFEINDAWAGVDTGTVVVTLSGISQTTSGYHYVFSGTDLDFQLNHGSVLLGNSGGYDVTLNPSIDFPASGDIMVLVSGADLKGLYTNDDWTFTTRPSCDSMACCEPIILQTGYNAGIWTGLYINSDIYISGGNDAEFVWTGGDFTGYIDCNTESDGLSIYSGHGDNSGSANFLAFQELSGLYFSGQNVKAMLTGINLDTIILYRFGNFEVKVYPSNRYDPGYKGNEGKMFIYANGDRSTVLYSGYLTTNTNGTGSFIEDVPTGIYDIVYKGHSHLGSYLSGITITGGQEISLDFTTGPDLYYTKTEGVDETQIAGDMKNSQGEYDGEINVGDITILILSSDYYGGAVDQWNSNNLNGDTLVTSADLSVIIDNFNEKGVYYLSNPIFGGFSW